MPCWARATFSAKDASTARHHVLLNKIPGIRARLVHDHFSAKQGVQDDGMNVICMGGRTVGPAAA